MVFYFSDEPTASIRLGFFERYRRATQGDVGHGRNAGRRRPAAPLRPNFRAFFRTFFFTHFFSHFFSRQFLPEHSFKIVFCAPHPRIYPFSPLSSSVILLVYRVFYCTHVSRFVFYSCMTGCFTLLSPVMFYSVITCCFSSVSTVVYRMNHLYFTDV